MRRRCLLWLAWHACLALWALALWCQRAVFNSGASARHAAALESLAAGWMLVTVTGLALWSGVSFSLAGTVGDVAGELARVASVVLTGIAALSLESGWPTLRRWSACAAPISNRCSGRAPSVARAKNFALRAWCFL